MLTHCKNERNQLRKGFQSDAVSAYDCNAEVELLWSVGLLAHMPVDDPPLLESLFTNRHKTVSDFLHKSLLLTLWTKHANNKCANYKADYLYEFKLNDIVLHVAISDVLSQDGHQNLEFIPRRSLGGRVCCSNVRLPRGEWAAWSGFIA